MTTPLRARLRETADAAHARARSAMLDALGGATGSLALVLDAAERLPPERAVMLLEAEIARLEGLRTRNGVLAGAGGQAVRALLSEAALAAVEIPGAPDTLPDRK